MKKSVMSCRPFLTAFCFSFSTCCFIQCITSDFKDLCNSVFLWLRNLQWSWCWSCFTLELLHISQWLFMLL